MSIRIEEVFGIQAHPDRVWSYLTDPREVVHCLPGAELTSVQDDTTFLGRVKVKVGPIATAYAGKVILTERDDTNRVVKMTGEGRESSGSGSAKMTMTSSVVGLPSGGSEVRVTAEIDIVGRVAQFGRGMIESVNKQMFKQFTECVRSTLAQPAETPAASTAAEMGAAASASSPPPLVSVIATPTSGSIIPASSTAPTPASATSTVSAQPVRLLPVLFRALGDYLLGLLSRLVGRKRGGRGPTP
jgi:carbon monoxide dehydrogenase subunit G